MTPTNTITEEMIQRAIKYQTQTAPDVYKYLKKFEIVAAESDMDVVDRLHQLLRNVRGISYTYSGFRFGISVEMRSGQKDCLLNIYTNAGEHKKHRQTGLFTSEPFQTDKNQFVIEMDDLTRYFGNLFIYIVENFSKETIIPFSADDLNYGLYCPDETDSEDNDENVVECDIENNIQRI
jgi:hypothetical protein